MASDKEYLNFVLEQLAEIEEITFRKMMGEYILYYKNKIFGGIYDNRFLVKITQASKNLVKECIEEIPYEGAKPMLLVEDIDNKEFLKKLIFEMYPELPERKLKKK